MKKLILVLILLLLISLHIKANFSLYNQDDLNNKLSNNSILCIHQDSYGFIWIGTYDGLNLYDGKKVTTFRYESDTPSSLSGNTIHGIYNYGKDYLWVSTQMGLNKFSIKQRCVTETYPQYKQINFIATDYHNNTWLIKKNNYISYYDPKIPGFKEIYYKEGIITTIKSLFVNHNNHLCVIKNDGELQIITIKNRSTLNVTKIKIHNKMITQAFYEDDSLYFIDSDNNLYFYDIYKQQKFLLRNIMDVIKKYGTPISLIRFHQSIFIAFIHTGLVKIDLSDIDKNSVEEINMTIGVFTLHKDRFQDVIWVGTDGMGVSLYYNAKDKFSNILNENLPFITRRPIRSFYTDEHNSLWVGTKGDGIFRINNYSDYANKKIPLEKVQRFFLKSDLSETPVYFFKRSSYNKNNLWIAGDGGIYYYSYKTNHIYKLEDSKSTPTQSLSTHSLCEINDSTLWIASNGLCKIIIDKRYNPYRIKSRTYYPFIKSGNLIYDEYYSLVYDEVSKIYYGSRRGYGVLYIDINTGKYNLVSMKNAQNKGLGDIISLYLDHNSNLYVGASSGLTKIEQIKDQNHQIKQFNRNNGIINDMIHGILEDNHGIIWLSTNKGLVKYNPKNDLFFNVKSSQIGVSEYTDNACWRCPITNRLFFGGVNGLVWLDPNQVDLAKTYHPKLFFTEFESQGKIHTLYDYNDKERVLKLPANENTFNISFAVLDYTNGESYDFSYKLDNYNKDWIQLQKENKISFIKIPPGNYSLIVKYKNDVLYNNDILYKLQIVILPPWYMSKIAYLIYSIICILILTLVFYSTQKKIRKKQLAIALQIREEQKEKMYESKLRFFTNITHELYTPLTLINGAVEQIKKESLNEKLKKYTIILQNNVMDLHELIQEILDYRKLEEFELKRPELKIISVSDIINKILNSFTEQASKNEINLSIAVQENLYWYTDQSSIKKIMYNLVSNSFKYTPAGGIVKIDARIDTDSLKLMVYNTGRGIEPDKLNSIFNRYQILEDSDINAKNQLTSRNGLGLFICYGIAKQLKGKIEVESKVNEYVQFTVVLPNLQKRQSSESSYIKNKDLTLHEKENKIPIQFSSNFNPGRILVVDDNSSIVNMIEDILSPEYTVLKSYNAKEALETLKTQTPSIIITDIMMPEMDGLSFIRVVKKDIYNKNIPIIALSAKVEERDQARGYEVGADVYLTKPFSSTVLLSMVKRLYVNKTEIKNYYDTVDSAFEYNYGVLMHQKDKEFIDKLINIIKHNIEDPQLGPEFIAENMKISSRNLYRQLKKTLNISPSTFIKDYKLAAAAKLLINSNLSIKEIIYKIGISNKSYFYKEFAKKYSMSPKQYKENRKSH